MLPVAKTHNRHWIRILGNIVGLQQQSSLCRTKSQNVEVIAAYQFRVRKFRLVAPLHTHLGGVGGQHSAEYRIAIAEVAVHRVGEIGAARSAARTRAPRIRPRVLQLYKLLRVTHRQPPEEHLVAKRKNCGVSPDSQR